jgi:hypothetical protein
MGVHDKFLSMVNRLLTKHGRTVTLIELNDVGALPWEGATAPAAAPKRSLVTKGCFVEPDSLQRLGLGTHIEELVQRSKRIFLAPGPAVLEGFNQVIDEAQYYTITGMETLRPGTTTLLHFVGVNR